MFKKALFIFGTLVLATSALADQLSCLVFYRDGAYSSEGPSLSSSQHPLVLRDDKLVYTADLNNAVPSYLQMKITKDGELLAEFSGHVNWKNSNSQMLQVPFEAKRAVFSCMRK